MSIELNLPVWFEWALIDNIDSEYIFSWHCQFRAGGISGNVVWKYELILGLTLSFTEVFSTKDQQG